MASPRFGLGWLLKIDLLMCSKPLTRLLEEVGPKTSGIEMAVCTLYKLHMDITHYVIRPHLLDLLLRQFPR